MYISLDYYKTLYDTIDERTFNNLSFEACRMMDVHTTGIDNIKKLKRFFPTDTDSVEAVKHCAAKLVNTLHQIQQAEASAAMGRGYIQTEQGLRGKIVSRVEAGNEAVSYSETKSANTEIDAAAADRTVRNRLLTGIIRDCLAGVSDRNGVCLLYMGVYPRRYLC